jgi:hypothetical protein
VISPIVRRLRAWVRLSYDITRDFDSIAKAFFVEYVTDVVLNCTHAYLELGRDFLVGQTARNGERDAILRIRQRFILKRYWRVVEIA